MDDELQKQALDMFKSGRFAPLMLMIRIMQRCNARCQMCDFWKTNDEGISFEKLCEIIDDASDLKTVELRFTGGEPTLYPKFFDILEYAKNKGIRTSFVTNGSTLTESMINKIISKDVHHIHVSIDSNDPKIHDWERGTLLWEKAINGLKILSEKKAENKPLVVINYIVSNFNYKQIPDLIEFGGGKLFDYIKFMAIKVRKDWFLTQEQIHEYNNNIVPKIIEKAREKNVVIRSGSPNIFGVSQAEIENSSNGNYTEELYSKIGCLVSKYTLFINENGDVYPCSNTPYKKSPFILGNVFEKRLKDIWGSKKYYEGIANAGNSKLCTGCGPINVMLNRRAKLPKIFQSSGL